MRNVEQSGGIELISHVPASPSYPVPLLFVHGAFVAAWCWDDHFLPYFAQHGFAALPDNVVVYSVDGPFFFGAVENFERALHENQTVSGTVVIRMRWVPFIDITGLQSLEEAIVELHKRGVRVMLTGANARVEGKLQKAGIIDLIGREHFFKTFTDAMQACSAA